MSIFAEIKLSLSAYLPDPGRHIQPSSFDISIPKRFQKMSLTGFRMSRHIRPKKDIGKFEGCFDYITVLCTRKDYKTCDTEQLKVTPDIILIQLSLLNFFCQFFFTFSRAFCSSKFLSMGIEWVTHGL